MPFTLATILFLLELARFNVQIGVVDKKYFVGVASPLAAILVIVCNGTYGLAS
ncbi:MAG: hypothetical protein U1E92_04235 [Moraxella osloensis]